ncbi:GerAB/ArcD/ProY family transporter [Niallia sp. Krafla_26]|uniref:GerAB/ArcD/ProY family transporter n=1 Tax=Niallia sp. Krafla_26 TaxID=3064703 RepID=UPI003D16EDBF
MKQQPRKIKIREFMAIMISVIGAKATEDTPVGIYHQVQNAAWMIPILTGTLFILPLYLLLKTLSLFEGKGLFQGIQLIFGRYVGFVICLILFFIHTLVVSFDSRTYSDIIRSHYFPTTPYIVIYGILMFVCAYGAKRGIEHIGMVAYLIVFYSFISINIALLLSLQDTSIELIFPIWGSGKLEILKASTLRFNLYVEFIVAALFIPYMTSMKDFKKGTWFTFIIIMIQLSISILVYICLFDRSLGSIGYPFHALIRFISIGNFLANVEILFFPVWIVGSFIRFAVAIYIGALMFGAIFKIKDFEYLIPAITIMYLLIGFIPETPADVSLDFKPLIRNVTGITYVALAILLWIVALLKGEFKHAKKKTSV